MTVNKYLPKENKKVNNEALEKRTKERNNNN